MKQLKKTILTLVALLAVTTGAWADETLLLTIESKDYQDFYSGSKTFDDMVTITFSKSVDNFGDEYGWYASDEGSLLTVAGINGYTITSCKFYTYDGDAANGYTVQGESPSVYLSASTEVYTDANPSVYIGYYGITKIEVYGGVASSPTGPEVAWNKAEKTGTFTMPGGNVTLEPEYYPQAVLTAAPTAINDVPATTDGAIVKAGTVANIGSTETAQGTVMYYVSPKALDDAALLALAADKWTADVPTAEKLTEGKAYVYYYVRGNDSDTDEENFSDGDILAANALTVTIAAEPTYAVTFAEGTDPNEWTADPKADVKKGQTVTVTYTGSKKVLGVKAEKKAGIVNPAVGQIIGSDGNNYGANATLPTGVTAVAKICYVGSETGVAGYTNGLALALTDKGEMIWSEATGTSGAAAHTPAAPTNTSSWMLPSRDQWNKMINAAGGYTALRDGFSGITGASNLQSDGYYWSSTEYSAGRAWRYDFDDGIWSNNDKYFERQVRACLAF